MLVPIYFWQENKKISQKKIPRYQIQLTKMSFCHDLKHPFIDGDLRLSVTRLRYRQPFQS